MIYEKDGLFILSTQNTSYAFKINAEGLPEHLHYGAFVPAPLLEGDDTARALSEKVSHSKGTTVNYKKDSNLVTEDMLLEISSTGKGDFRNPFAILRYADGSCTSDFVYQTHEVMSTSEGLKTLPSSYADNECDRQQLKVTFKERVKSVRLVVTYNVYPKCDVITRYTEIYNDSDAAISIQKLMSTQVDFDDSGFRITTFGGNWGREMHRHDTVIEHGTYVNQTNTGVSSNRNNPFVMLAKTDTSETAGEGYGFNLVYSGNHYEAVDVSGFGKTRFLSGINPEGFSWEVLPNDSFETPEAVMTFTTEGYRGISLNMQHFVREHIVRGKYKGKPRPILLNSWEAAYFNINESRLLKLADKAREAGIELLVMDDGWFKDRNNDKSSLGDWVCDARKLPAGIAGIARKVHAKGLDFGIWVEPEMVNEDSDLYRAHPEYAMTVPGRDNSPGRNQMLLDLTIPEVVEYVKNSMRGIFGTKGVNYVKWDMNRMFADIYSKVIPPDRQGETLHRYYIGLYDIMSTLTKEFPDILFEGCASGGNRFDLGILSYFPQIWASDDTDAYERTIIQSGYSYGYPMSVVTAHVSQCPNHQTLRNTPIETRFNVAAFGVLGYEINLCETTKEEFDAIKMQVECYKKWRDVFFFGDFYRVSDKQWMVVSPDKQKAVTMLCNGLCNPNDFYAKLRTVGLDESLMYHIYNVKLKFNLKLFGDLVNQVAPVHIKKDSAVHNVIAHFVKMDGETEDYNLSGIVLNNAGIKLKQAFGGTGYNDETRLFQDFYSRMYFIEAL